MFKPGSKHINSDFSNNRKCHEHTWVPGASSRGEAKAGEGRAPGSLPNLVAFDNHATSLTLGLWVWN